MSNYKIAYDCLETKVWCIDKKNEDMGLSAENLWLPMIIDISSIIAVKYCKDEEESHADGMAVIYIANDAYVVNIPYKEMVDIWLKFKEGKKPIPGYIHKDIIEFEKTVPAKSQKDQIVLEEDDDFVRIKIQDLGETAIYKEHFFKLFHEFNDKCNYR